MEINGKKVVDAKKHLDVEVTKEDCTKGKTKDPGACAAARAILRENENALGARVHRGVTYVEYTDKWVRYLTPVSLRTELTVFDRGAGFEPGSHTLGAPTGTAQSLGYMDEYRKTQRAQTPDPRHGHSKNRTRHHRHEIPHIRPRGANR